MSESRKRRFLWPIVAVLLTLPTAGAAVIYAVAKPWRSTSSEEAPASPDASLDTIAQAVVNASDAPPKADDPLTFMNDLPPQPEAEKPPVAVAEPTQGASRYGTVAPIATDSRYGSYAEVAPLAQPESDAEYQPPPVPAEPDVTRGQSPDNEADTVEPLANPLRGGDRYGALPALSDLPPAMTGEVVNPLRENTKASETPMVEPLESEATSADVASSPTNPFARTEPTSNEQLPPEPVAVEPDVETTRPLAANSESPASGMRSVLVGNRNASELPPSRDSLVPVEPATPGAFAAREETPPLNSEPVLGEGVTGAGKPGERALEGPQRSGLLVQKFAPAEIQIGKPCKFVVKVRNESNQPVTEIVIRDEVPQGTKLISTTPTAQANGSEVVWQIGNLSPGEELAVEMQLEPTAEGQIGSVATVTHAAHASARTICTRPQLALRLSAPPQVLVGRQQHVQIEIHNPGTGDATGVLLLENVPDNLRHPAGSSLEFEIGTLRAGETRQLELLLTAEKPGEVINRLVAKGDGHLQIEESVPFKVVAPALEVAVDGPRRRFLDRPATYLVNVNNPGTAPARDVQLITKLPRGMRFVRANNMGEYNSTTHSVHWSLAELPEGKDGSVELVAMPVEAGQHTLEVEGRASEGLEASHRQEVQIEGLAAIDFEVLDLEDPIEVGGETNYEIKVANQGTKAATNVRVAAMLPPGMNLLSASGETGHRVESGSVVFEPIASLAPKSDTVYRLQVQVAQPGDLRLAVEIQTDDLQQPIRKEESTRVFGDE